MPIFYDLSRAHYTLPRWLAVAVVYTNHSPQNKKRKTDDRWHHNKSSRRRGISQWLSIKFNLQTLKLSLHHKHQEYSRPWWGRSSKTTTTRILHRLFHTSWWLARGHTDMRRERFNNCWSSPQILMTNCKFKNWINSSSTFLIRVMGKCMCKLS